MGLGPRERNGMAVVYTQPRGKDISFMIWVLSKSVEGQILSLESEIQRHYVVDTLSGHIYKY